MQRRRGGRLRTTSLVRGGRRRETISAPGPDCAGKMRAPNAGACGFGDRAKPLVTAIVCLSLLLNHPGSDAAIGSSDPGGGVLAFCAGVGTARRVGRHTAPGARTKAATATAPHRITPALQLRASSFLRAQPFFAGRVGESCLTLLAASRSAAGNSSVADANANVPAEGAQKGGAAAGTRKQSAWNSSAASLKANEGSSKRGVASRESRERLYPIAAKRNSTRKLKINTMARSSNDTDCRVAGTASSDGAFLTQSKWGGELGPIEALVMGKIIIDEFVLRSQPEAKVVRTGLGGGSPQAAVGARLWGGRIGLVAPVGQGFAQEMLSPLEIAGIDTQGVSRLKGYVTPHTQIRYEAERMIWTPGEGWDRWTELGREVLPIPEGYQKAKLLHVITEGAGGAEVDMTAEIISQASRDADVNTSLTATDEDGGSGPVECNEKCSARHEVVGMKLGEKSKSKSVLSIEPVIHTVTEGTIENLRRITSNATVVSPDWDTAVKISKMCTAAREQALGKSTVEVGSIEVTGCTLHPHLMGKYEMRKGGQYWGGRPVYAMTRGPPGGAQVTYYMYHKTTPGCASRWFMGPQEVTKSFTNAGSAVACLYVESEAVSPDEIDGPWQEYNSTSGKWIDGPNVRVSRGLPAITFKDVLAVRRTISADRGRMVMEREGMTATRVRSVEFDPRHLRVVIHEEELPLAQSRDVAIASKYTEDEGENEEFEEFEEEEEDEDEIELAESDEQNVTHAKVDPEFIQKLERSLSLDAVENEKRSNTSIAGKKSVDDEVEDTEFDSEAEADEESSGCGTMESSIQEFVLLDSEPAVKLQRLCASLGVPWLLEGSQRARWEDVESTLVVAEEVQDLWRAVVEEESGDVYFWNTVTDETSWERPPEMLRVSTAKDTKTTSVRSVKGDVTNFGQVYDKSEEDADDASASMPPPPLRGQRRTARKVEREGKAGAGSDAQAEMTQSEGQDNEWDPSPEVVLDRCAEALGMKDGARGILAVRRGAKGSYILDCQEPGRVWLVPCAQVSVVDPTGAGNAFSAALGYNLALLLPSEDEVSTADAPSPRDLAVQRREAVIQSACRATATGGAFVQCEGMPVPSETLDTWLRVQAAALRGMVRSVKVPCAQASEQGEGSVSAALTPPPALRKSVKSRKGTRLDISKDRDSTLQDGTAQGGTATGMRDGGKGRGKGKRGGRGAKE